MAQVKVIVNGRSFRMGCGDGEEGRVRELSTDVDSLVQKIKGGTKAVQDERLYLMAAILMADRLREAQDEILRLQRLAGDLRAYQVIDGGAQAIQRDLNRAMESGKAEGLQRANGTA